MTDEAPALPPDGVPLFSPRLDEILDGIQNGEIPNAGRFCGYCFTPIAERAVCPHCGRKAADTPPSASIPDDVLAMYASLRRRESLVVNAFAYLGLTIGVALFVAMVAIAVFYLDQAWWFLVLSMVVLLVGGRVLAGLLGGIVGDSLGYRYARRKLAEDWAAYEARRGAIAPPSTSLSPSEGTQTMATDVVEIDLRTPRVTASVHAILLALRESFPDARWSLACGLEPEECVLTIFADEANAWRVRDLVREQLDQARSREGISIVLLVQPLDAAGVKGVVSYPV